MEARIKDRYNESILQEAMRRYGIKADDINLLDGFESFLYEFRRGSGAYILRVGHSFRRSEALIQGEVDWINYLAAGGAPVARAVLSQTGRLVERIDDGQGECFLATSFDRARGKPAWEVGWTPELYERYGRLLGRMHALSKRYEVADPAWERPQWDDDIMLDVEGHLPAGDTAIGQKFEELMVHLRALPRDGDSYGLIHFDAHAGNFLVDEEGEITLFDFDDCNHSWYANDLAIVLFYTVMGSEDAQSFTREFMSHFMRGYRRENSLDASWLREIPHFLKLREIDLYAIIHRSFGADYADDPWCARYMQGRKQRIEGDVPYLDFDFESLAGLF